MAGAHLPLAQKLKGWTIELRTRITGHYDMVRSIFILESTNYVYELRYICKLIIHVHVQYLHQEDTEMVFRSHNEVTNFILYNQVPKLYQRAPSTKRKQPRVSNIVQLESRLIYAVLDRNNIKISVYHASPRNRGLWG